MRNAKRTITYAIMGLVVAGIAYAIVNALVGTVITDGGGGGSAVTNGTGANNSAVTGGM
jgi:K+-transporting ATPase c subunit